MSTYQKDLTKSESVTTFPTVWYQDDLGKIKTDTRFRIKKKIDDSVVYTMPVLDLSPGSYILTMMYSLILYELYDDEATVLAIDTSNPVDIGWTGWSDVNKFMSAGRPYHVMWPQVLHQHPIAGPAYFVELYDESGFVKIEDGVASSVGVGKGAATTWTPLVGGLARVGSPAAAPPPAADSTVPAAPTAVETTTPSADALKAIDDRVTRLDVKLDNLSLLIGRLRQAIDVGASDAKLAAQRHNYNLSVVQTDSAAQTDWLASQMPDTKRRLTESAGTYALMHLLLR